MIHIDSPWFVAKLAERKLSQRGLARFMGCDPASIHRLLQGKRPMRFDEASQLAGLLGVTVNDVISRAGIPVGAGALVPIVGHVDGAGVAEIDWGRSLGETPSPGDLPANAVAAAMRTAGTLMDPMDGWILFFAPPEKGVPAEAVGRLCVARLAGDGLTMVRFVRRGYQPGRWNLTALGGAVIEDAALDWAAPVLHIRT
jgi:transcriptional regulator with XRE-family HTH domain